MTPQQSEALTDGELLSVYTEPDLASKFTDEERKRLGRLLLAQKGEKNIPSGDRADTGMIGVDHNAILQSVADLASGLRPSLQKPAAATGTFALDALASLLEMLSAPESVAGMGAGPVSKGMDAAAPYVGKGLSAAGRGVEAAGRGMRWPMRGMSAYQMVTNPSKAAISYAAPEATQMLGRGMQRAGQALIPAEEVPAAALELPRELTKRVNAAQRAKYPKATRGGSVKATSRAESAVDETAPPSDSPQSAPTPSPSRSTDSPKAAHPTRSTGQLSPAAIQSDLGIAARRAGVKLTEPQYQQAEALVRQGQTVETAVADVSGATRKPALSSAETTLYLKLRDAGKTEAEAADAIRTAREASLDSLLGKLPTDAEMRAAVKQRNATKRWGPAPGSKLERAKREQP